MKSLEDYLDMLDIKDEYKRFFNKLFWMFGDKKILEDVKNIVFNDDIKENLEYLEEFYE